MLIYDDRTVSAHGSNTSAQVYLMNEAPGPREAVSGFPLFGDQGGNLYRALWRADVSWAKSFNQGSYFSWPKYNDDHYKNGASNQKAILRRDFLELRFAHITCSNSYDRWPKSPGTTDDWIAPSTIDLCSEGNLRRISSEIGPMHSVLLICGNCAWRAIFHKELKGANQKIGQQLNTDELSKANSKLGASFREAFYMGHTSKWGKTKYQRNIVHIFKRINQYLDVATNTNIQHDDTLHRN
jgi:hypothetical protein